MEYKRLTFRHKSVDGTEQIGYTEKLVGCYRKEEMILNRLAELEDKIEQGTLIELPTMLQDKQGDWRVYFYSERYGLIDCYVYDTREEAEKRLRELQGDKE